MLPGIEYIKTFINGILFHIENLSKEIDKKISDNLEASKADWNQNDQNAPEHVKNRPMYSYQENVGTEYSVSELTSKPLPLVLGEEWYIMGDYAGEKDQYLPECTKTIFTVGKNGSGDLCISDSSYEFNTGSESSSGNRFIIYADHIYQNTSWVNMTDAKVLSVYRLAEPSYKTAYKTIDSAFLPMAGDNTAGIVNPNFSPIGTGTDVVVDKDGRLFCDTAMPILTVSTTLHITLDFHGRGDIAFLMFYQSSSSADTIYINDVPYKIYVNGESAGIPSGSHGHVFLAIAQELGKKLHLINSPNT